VPAEALLLLWHPVLNLMFLVAAGRNTNHAQ
jgi:hypothetical protein